MMLISEFNRLAGISFDGRLKEAILATKSDLNTLLQNANKNQTNSKITNDLHKLLFFLELLCR